MPQNIKAMIWFEFVWVVYLAGRKGADITSWNNFWQETLNRIVVIPEIKAISR